MRDHVILKRLRAHQAFLLDLAIALARARRDQFVVTLLGAINIKKPSAADTTLIADYLHSTDTTKRDT